MAEYLTLYKLAKEIDKAEDDKLTKLSGIFKYLYSIEEYTHILKVTGTIGNVKGTHVALVSIKNSKDRFSINTGYKPIAFITKDNKYIMDDEKNYGYGLPSNEKHLEAEMKRFLKIPADWKLMSVEQKKFAKEYEKLLNEKFDSITVKDKDVNHFYDYLIGKLKDGRAPKDEMVEFFCSMNFTKDCKSVHYEIPITKRDIAACGSFTKMMSGTSYYCSINDNVSCNDICALEGYSNSCFFTQITPEKLLKQTLKLKYGSNHCLSVLSELFNSKWSYSKELSAVLNIASYDDSCCAPKLYSAYDIMKMAKIILEAEAKFFRETILNTEYGKILIRVLTAEKDFVAKNDYEYGIIWNTTKKNFDGSRYPDRSNVYQMIHKLTEYAFDEYTGIPNKYRVDAVIYGGNVIYERPVADKKKKKK